MLILMVVVMLITILFYTSELIINFYVHYFFTFVDKVWVIFEVN